MTSKKKLSAADCDFDPEVLPEVLQDKVTEFEEQFPGADIEREVRHYWEETCLERFGRCDRFVLRTLSKLRMCFRKEFKELGW